MTETTVAQIRSIAGRLTSFRTTGHPLATQEFEKGGLEHALIDGVDPHVALERAGVAKPVVEMIRNAQPDDFAGVLSDVANALARTVAHHQALRSAATYPFLLALVGLFLGLLTQFAILPQFRNSVAFEADAGILTSAPVLMVFVLCLGLLFLLFLSMRTTRPVFPFANVRTNQEIALLLSATSALTKRNVALPKALRAASLLAGSQTVVDIAKNVAAGLENDTVSPDASRLFGDLGAGLFATAVSEGAGSVIVAALADVREQAAAVEIPAQIIKAELISLGLGGFCVAVPGVALFVTYANLIGGAG